MCGRIAQAKMREDYLSFLAYQADRDIAFDPIGCCNEASDTKVLLLSECDEQLHLDPRVWMRQDSCRNETGRIAIVRSVSPDHFT